MRSMPSNTSDTAEADGKATLLQVADLCARTLKLKTQLSVDNSTFTSSASNRNQGVYSVSGQLQDDGLLTLQLQLLQIKANQKSALVVIFARLSTLGGKVSALAPESQPDGTAVLSVGMEVKATPMSVTRSVLTILSKHSQFLAALPIPP